MTAVRADILYQAKKIQDKAKFKCLGKNCTAQVTCANLDKPLAERINKLHFRIYGHHTDGCSIKKDIDNDNNLSPEKKEKK
ncbi:unnamed protein product [Commensalibacter communis]|nr:unnamed protein product [Commensalibacter communis]